MIVVNENIEFYYFFATVNAVAVATNIVQETEWSNPNQFDYVINCKLSHKSCFCFSPLIHPLSMMLIIKKQFSAYLLILITH